MNQVYLILGSNIDPEKNILLALRELTAFPDISLIKTSEFYRTRPVGNSEADFINIAVLITTPLDRFDLKEKTLCSLEEKLGRVRVADKFAPRTIDMDIVIFNGEVLDMTLFKHDYMILTFAELIPELVSPQYGITLKTLATTIRPFSMAKKVDLPV